MSRPRSVLVLLAAGSLCAGCLRGALYHNVTLPLVTNMDRTPVGAEEAKMDSRQLRVPRVHLTFVWKSRAIGDAAQAAALEEVYYADLNTFSLLSGIWKQQTVRVWGKAGASTPDDH